MSQFAYLLTYLGLAVFVLAALRRIVAYKKNPQHLRWELYPVPHEGGGRASYGGSYLEDLEWWNKPRETSRIGELSVMVPEMLFLKALWEHNRSLWLVSFPFHFGLYLTFGLVALLTFCAIGQLAGLPVDSGLVALVNVQPQLSISVLSAWMLFSSSST